MLDGNEKETIHIQNFITRKTLSDDLLSNLLLLISLARISFYSFICISNFYPTYITCMTLKGLQTIYVQCLFKSNIHTLKNHILILPWLQIVGFFLTPLIKRGIILFLFLHFKFDIIRQNNCKSTFFSEQKEKVRREGRQDKVRLSKLFSDCVCCAFDSFLFY